MSSNLPPGTPSPYLSLVSHTCPNGHVWQALMWYELGGWFYQDEEEALCPTCGAEDVDSDF